jgi:uncharacterized protein (DUF2147 family)
VRFWLIVMTSAALAAPAAAPEPTGEWLVADGTAHIRIVDCGEALWGVVSWQKKPMLDRHNPDPALRSRPTLGIPVLRNMKKSAPGRWEGEIYNARDGNTYDASIELKNPDTLHVEGCTFTILCGSQDWTRLTPAQPTQAQQNGETGTATGGATASDPTTAPAAAICTRIGAGAGRPHENRLEQHRGGQRA